MATFNITLAANIVATKTFKVTADTLEDAVGDALDLAASDADGWEITRNFDNLTESDYTVVSAEGDEPEDEETEDVMPTEEEFLASVAAGVA